MSRNADVQKILEAVEELKKEKQEIPQDVIDEVIEDIKNDIMVKMTENQRILIAEMKKLQVENSQKAAQNKIDELQYKVGEKPNLKQEITKTEMIELLDEKLTLFYKSRNWDDVADKMAKKLMQIFNETEEKTDIETDKTTEIKVKEQPTEKQIAEAKTDETPTLKEVLTEIEIPKRKGIFGMSY